MASHKENQFHTEMYTIMKGLQVCPLVKSLSVLVFRCQRVRSWKKNARNSFEDKKMNSVLQHAPEDI